jgi:hypothetical protein
LNYILSLVEIDIHTLQLELVVAFILALLVETMLNADGVPELRKNANNRIGNETTECGSKIKSKCVSQI